MDEVGRHTGFPPQGVEGVRVPRELGAEDLDRDLRARGEGAPVLPHPCPPDPARVSEAVDVDQLHPGRAIHSVALRGLTIVSGTGRGHLGAESVPCASAGGSPSTGLGPGSAPGLRVYEAPLAPRPLTFHVYNSLTRSKAPFSTIEDGVVRMYSPN